MTDPVSKSKVGSGEMTQRQASLAAALTEDPVGFSMPIGLLADFNNTSSWGSDALFWPSSALHTCAAQIHAGQTLMHTKINKTC